MAVKKKSKKRQYLYNILDKALLDIYKTYTLDYSGKLTAGEIRKYKAERMKKGLAEKKRRAKKITMTVGEYEDKIEAAKDEVRSYDW